MSLLDSLEEASDRFLLFESALRSVNTLVECHEVSSRCTFYHC